MLHSLHRIMKYIADAAAMCPKTRWHAERTRCEPVDIFIPCLLARNWRKKRAKQTMQMLQSTESAIRS
jgi:hypothetical protein